MVKGRGKRNGRNWTGHIGQIFISFIAESRAIYSWPPEGDCEMSKVTDHQERRGGIGEENGELTLSEVQWHRV